MPPPAVLRPSLFRLAALDTRLLGLPRYDVLLVVALAIQG